MYARVGRLGLLYGSQRLTRLWTGPTRGAFRGRQSLLSKREARPGRLPGAAGDRQPQPLRLRRREPSLRRLLGHLPAGQGAYHRRLLSLPRLGSRVPASAGRSPAAAAATMSNTVGGRYNGFQAVPGRCCGSSPGSVLWDFEDSYQFGAYTNRDLSAAMSSSGVGWAFSRVPMQPQFWVYYDSPRARPTSAARASSTPSTSCSRSVTTTSATPIWSAARTARTSTCRPSSTRPSGSPAVTQSHMSTWTRLRTPYPVRPRAMGSSGEARRSRRKGRGDELEFSLSFQLEPASDLQFGYSKFLRGGFIDATGAAESPSCSTASISSVGKGGRTRLRSRRELIEAALRSPAAPCFF